MSETLKLLAENILATGTVTVSGGSADSDYPASRLYDWSKNFLWKIVTGSSIEAAENITIHVDYGAAVTVDTLFISNHNFDGYDMTWEYSTDDTAWSNAVSGWAQSGTGVITKTLSSSVSARYWRVTINGADLECGEIIMGLASEFKIMALPIPRHSQQPNVDWNRSVSGQVWGIKLGDSLRIRMYTLRMEASDLATFQGIIDDMDELSQPLLIKDKDDNWFIARLDRVPTEEILLQNDRLTDVDVTLVEMY